MDVRADRCQPSNLKNRAQYTPEASQGKRSQSFDRIGQSQAGRRRMRPKHRSPGREMRYMLPRSIAISGGVFIRFIFKVRIRLSGLLMAVRAQCDGDRASGGATRSSLARRPSVRASQPRLGEEATGVVFRRARGMLRGTEMQIP